MRLTDVWRVISVGLLFSCGHRHPNVCAPESQLGRSILSILTRFFQLSFSEPSTLRGLFLQLWTNCVFPAISLTSEEPLTSAQNNRHWSYLWDCIFHQSSEASSRCWEVQFLLTRCFSCSVELWKGYQQELLWLLPDDFDRQMVDWDIFVENPWWSWQ